MTVFLGASQTFRIARNGFLGFGLCVYTGCRKDLFAPGAVFLGSSQTFRFAWYDSLRLRALCVHELPKRFICPLGQCFWGQAKLFGLLGMTP